MKSGSIAIMMSRLMLMLMLISILLLGYTLPVAGSDELKRSLLRDIISKDKTELFNNYGELALAKAKTQTVIQGMPGYEVTAETRNWVNILIKIINDFEAMTTLSENEEPSYHIGAIRKAEAINNSIYELRRYETPEREGIPMLLELALKRFYRKEGFFFQNIAANTGETRLKIEYEYTSSNAYALGGMPSDATRMEFEARRDERIYNRDMNRAKEYINASELHLHKAMNSHSAFFGAAFMQIIKARDSFEQAKELYEKHKDKELENVKVRETEIEAVYRRLMLDTLEVVALYLIALSLITGILWMKFMRWHGELDDTMLGEELIE